MMHCSLCGWAIPAVLLLRSTSKQQRLLRRTVARCIARPGSPPAQSRLSELLEERIMAAGAC